MTTLQQIAADIEYPTSITSNMYPDDTLTIQLSNGYYVEASFYQMSDDILLYSLNHKFRLPDLTFEYETVNGGYVADFEEDSFENVMQDFVNQIDSFKVWAEQH